MKKSFFKQSYPIFLLALSAALVVISSFPPSTSKKLQSEAARVERALHRRQTIIEKYAIEALQSDGDWMEFDNLPEDMVLYCFRSDSLKFWANVFPVGNDRIDTYGLSYRLQDMKGNENSSPLAYVGMKEQYINLGSGWYIVNTHISKDHRTRIVTGILVRTEYATGNLRDEVNRKLRLHKGFTSESIGVDDSAIVYGIEGEPLFSIVTDAPSAYERSDNLLRWIALLLVVVAVFAIHYRQHTKRTFAAAVIILVVGRTCAALLAGVAADDTELFSPIVYADNALFDSLGSLLINNTFVALLIYALFAMRFSFLRPLELEKRGRRVSWSVSLSVVSLALIWYIHMVMRSLIDNSGISMQVSRMETLSGYSALCLISFAMLYLALLYLLQMAVMCAFKSRSVNLFSWKNALIYIAVISLYSVTAIGTYSFGKEFETNRVRTGKIAIERDLSLELYLRNIEQSIANDQFIAILSGAGGIELIKNRLQDRYLTGDIISKYDIRLSLCTPDNLLGIGTGDEPVNCFSFYDDVIGNHGTELSPGSNFFFISNYNNQNSYIGVFTYIDSNDYAVSRLFIEIESRYGRGMTGYPPEILGSSGTGTSLPAQYSSAKYVEGRLVSSTGSYPYSVMHENPQGRDYYMENAGGFIHFVNCISADSTTIISRPRRSVFPYIVSFSYFYIFFGIFILLFTVWGRKTKLFNLPKHTLRRKIALLTTGTMAAALLCMGIGSVTYVVRLNAATDSERMAEKIESIQSALTPYLRYALRYNDLLTEDFILQIDNAASINQTDINIYDREGRLVHSTRPELFDRFILGRRMNGEAFKAVHNDHSLRFSTVEKAAGIKYTSVYAPLFNNDGDMVAIVNFPYLNRNRDANNATLATVSAIINIYLILLIAAMVLGAIMSNSMSRPLTEIKEKLDRLATSNSKSRHIRYRNSSDELGMLVASYNKMVDDLELSTKRLAQNEREQAWKEMARQIAHEIKNPLTPMRLSIQYLLRLKEQNVPGWEDKLEKISHSLLEQIDILSDTASEFSSFSKFFSEQVVEVNLDELIRTEAVLFDNRADIAIQYIQKVETPLVRVRRNQISRVLVNLITNAVQAIDNRGQAEGRIRIVLEADTYEGKPAYRLDVEDNGPGVPEDNLGRLFTPNFTTKTGGTGLGLAISKSILEQSQGSISYRKSTLGGACFSIILPA